jgi:hypothetical protein
VEKTNILIKIKVINEIMEVHLRDNGIKRQKLIIMLGREGYRENIVQTIWL